MILGSGVIRGGQVVVGEPIDLPDGTEVTISGGPPSRPEADDGPSTPDEIAADLAAMAALEPLDWTEQERAAWEAERRERKEWEKARFFDRAARSERLADVQIPIR